MLFRSSKFERAILVYTELYTVSGGYTQLYRAMKVYTELYRAVQNYTKLFGGRNVPDCVLNLLVLFGGTSF